MIDPFRILLSYHFYQAFPDMGPLLEKWFPDGVEVFADSGAYSALTQGSPIDVHSYGKWLVANKEHFCTYANLDEIGDGQASADGTWRNQRLLEDEYGLAPLPVFHTGEPWSALDRYLDSGYTYIALGGLVGKSRSGIMPWLVQCFRMGHGRAVFHGFGLTSIAPLAALPWYSVDSTAWAAGYRFATLPLFNPKTGRLVGVAMNNHAELFKFGWLIRKYGFDPADFTLDNYNRGRVCHLVALSWRDLEKYLRLRHGAIHVPGEEGPPGLRAYMAAAWAIDVLSEASADITAGLRLYLANGNIDDLSHGAGQHLDMTRATPWVKGSTT